MFNLNSFSSRRTPMKLNRYVFALVCATIGNNQHIRCHVDPMESMQKSMRIMEDEMQSMFDNMNKMHQEFLSSWKKESATQAGQEGINLAIDESKNNEVKVIVSGIQAEQFEATFGDKELTIKAPTATITLAVHHTVLAASINQEVKEEMTDKKDKEGKSSQQFFSSSSHIQQMISKPVDLQESKIDYDKETKTLTVIIPAKDQKKAAKVIPVNIK